MQKPTKASPFRLLDEPTSAGYFVPGRRRGGGEQAQRPSLRAGTHRKRLPSDQVCGRENQGRNVDRGGFVAVVYHVYAVGAVQSSGGAFGEGNGLLW